MTSREPFENWAHRETVAHGEIAPVPAAPRRRVWPTILVAVLVVAIAGVTAVAPRLLTHGRSSHQAGNGAVASPRFPTIFDGSLTTVLRFAGTGFQLLPPPVEAMATVTVSWQQALDTCWTSGGLCLSDLTAHVYLADFTETYSQPTPRLAWIIDYPVARCVPLGHPPALTSSLPSAQPMIREYDCRIVNIVDSRTGALLWSFRDGVQ